MDVVVAHEYADLDALACLVAARDLYPEACALRNARVSSLSRRYLALHRDALDLRSPKEVDPGAVETVVVVDTRKAGRLSEYADHLAAASRVVVWDHHPSSVDDIEADEAHIEPVGACATLLVEELARRDADVSPWKATLLLLGIYADTGRLSYPSTTSRDAEAAALLLRADANLEVVNRYLRQQFTREQRRLLVELMEGERELEIGGARISIVTAALDSNVDGAADVVQHLMQMRDDQAMVAAIDFGNRIQLIGRSRVPYVDVGALLAEFGGGGHAGAAGASRKGVDLETAVDELEEKLRAVDIAPTLVRDLMSSPVRVIERDTTLERCGGLLEQWGVTGAPVTSIDGSIEGVVSERDVARAARSDKLDLPVSSHMSHETVTVGPDASLEEALERMTDEEIGRMPVCDGGRLVGIVTRTDVRNALYGEESSAES